MNQKKIKITHILAELGFGGAERLLLDIIRSTDRSCFDIEVVCVVTGGAFEKELEKIDVPVTIIGKNTKLGLDVFWKIRKHLLQTKPDIVHTHLFAGDFWGKIGAKLAGIKCIISTEHNVNISEGFMKDTIKTFTNTFTKKIIAVSGAVKKYTIKKYKTSADKIDVIYNGIDLSRFHFKIPDFDKEKIILGSVGRLTEQKGHRYLIDAFEKIIEKFPQAELWIVGEGELKEKLQTQIEKLKLAEHVKLLGTRRDIPEILTQFDVFVMPSLWEGLGITVIEAMVTGLPVIASGVDGLRELIEDGETGILVESKNAESLAEAIMKLLEDQSLAISLGKNAKQEIVENFDMTKMVKKYEEAYMGALDK